MINSNKTFKMVLSAMFLAMAYLLPFLTGQIPKIGSMLCPMHLPILLCGFLCGPLYAFSVGAVAPLLRSLTLGVPVLFPMAICMSFELAFYGVSAGFMHILLPKKKPYIYTSLIIAMLVGRVVWGICMLIFLGISGSRFTFSTFIASAFTNALPGIILQIAVIPIIVMLYDEKILKRRQDYKNERRY